MKKNIISILTVICFVPITGITVNADEIDNTSSNITTYSTGLIKEYSLSISKNGNSILLSVKTNSNDVMNSIGIKDIVIEKSCDNTTWSDYIDVNDLLVENSMQYLISKKQIATVPNGYYYRVTCNHYAKENGLFGSSESIPNTSNSVYIP